MSERKQNLVSRAYKSDANACTHAVALLLRNLVRVEGSPALATLKDTRGETNHDSRATKYYT